MAAKAIKYIELAKTLNVGVNTLKDYLKEKDIEVPSPNAPVDDKALAIVLKEYSPNENIEDFKKKMETATPPPAALISERKKEEVVAKVVEVKEKEAPQPASPEEKKEVKEEVKTVSKVEVRGRIDLSQTQPQKGGKTSDKKIKKASTSTPVNVNSKQQEEPSTPAKVVEKVPTPAVQIEPKPIAKEQEPIAKEETPAEVLPAAETESTDQQQEIYRPSTPKAIQVTVVRKIDLDSINPPKKNDSSNKNKRRKRIGSQAVDIKTEAAKGIDPVAGKRNQNHGASKPNGGKGQNSSSEGKNKKKNNRPVTPPKPEITEEDVQKQVKETLARLQGKKTVFEKKARFRKDRRDAARQAAEDAFEADERESRILKLTEYVTVSDLANMMNIPVNEVIATCMSIDMMVSINMRLDAETIKLVAEEFGFETEFVSSDVVAAIQESTEEDSEEDLLDRAPIVTVMGHVDHGKTSLLDNIRKTNVIAGEAGGITQHIGSYSVKLPSGRHITFLDTPGHEAFTAMRARGAKATDIAIIIIASDDKVMPQTVEAINHATAAGVPMVFAFNKIDVAGADPNKIREQLASMNYLVEDWGGKYQCQEISAKKGIGVNELLEKVLLEADILELKANPKRRASGLIIESSLDKGRGYVSNILVQNGTLRVGDVILAGKYYGRVKAMTNERNQALKEAGPSIPATILGFNGPPSAGDTFNVLETEHEARDIANKRTQLEREQGLRTQKMLTLDDIGRRIAIGNFQELNLIIKGDVDGSVEALSDSLIRLSAEEIVVRVIHKGVGQISESDVVLAEASQAIIIGFQVRPSAGARKSAEQAGVEIRTYSIIYDAIEDVRSAMEGMLSPEIKEQVTALLEIQQTFTIGKVGTIAGCMVKEGKIHRTDKVRIIRDGIVIHTGALESLKRFKDDVKEVAMGLDCGLNIKGFNDLKEGDLIEAYQEIEIKKKL